MQQLFSYELIKLTNRARSNFPSAVTVTRAGRVIVEMKEKTFRNILDIAKKLELHIGFEQQIKHSGSSERKKTKLD
jgi:hypothetical protein